MKHPTLGFLLVAFVSPILMAQTNTYPFPSSGNVGIGTTSPSSSAPLHVFSSADADRYIRVENPSSGGSALAGLSVLNGSGSMAYFFLTGTGYTGVSAWGNKLVIGTDSGIAGGMLMRPASGGFQVTADGSLNNPNIMVTTAGNVGIGTASPASLLHLSGAHPTARVTASSGAAYILSEAGGIEYYSGAQPAVGGALVGTVSNHSINFYANNAERMRITPSGNVGIGTTNPTHKLAVYGTIRANEIIVDTGWADYVFAGDYQLAPLAEVEAHIKTHGHLPGIPSAAEVAEQGVSLGEMQSRILAKVEELTLHLIEIKKENQELRAELQALKSNSPRF